MKKRLSFMVKLWNQCYNSFVIRYRRITHGEKLAIHGRLRVFGHGTIRLGSDVGINSGISANPIGGDTQTIFSLKETAVLTIGDRVGISNTAIVCHDCVRETAVTKPVRIGEDVFIGAHSIILKGVTIGDRSIVGAGSVVTKAIPADEVWAGNPARCIRRISENPKELD